jgi:two-component system sensor histidine kinase ChiS
MTTLLALSVLTFHIVRRQHQRELKQAQALNTKLQELDATKNQVLANTSHELRTPLNGIVGLSELLLLDDKLHSEARNYVELIVHSGKRLTGVITDLLDFSRLQQHKTEANLQSYSLFNAADTALRLMMPLCGAKPLQLLNVIDPSLLVMADADRLQQIFCNLIGNAIKFTAAGQICLSAQHEGNFVCIEVSDTGDGIAVDAQERIFESFEQVESAFNRRHEGIGLGLAITRHLVQLHGGDIGVDSTLGVGSTFWFTLPVATPTNETV